MSFDRTPSAAPLSSLPWLARERNMRANIAPKNSAERLAGLRGPFARFIAGHGAPQPGLPLSARSPRPLFAIAALALCASLAAAFASPASAQSWSSTTIYGGDDGASSQSYSYCIFGQGCFQSQPSCQLAPDGSCAAYPSAPYVPYSNPYANQPGPYPVYPAYPPPYVANPPGYGGNPGNNPGYNNGNYNGGYNALPRGDGVNQGSRSSFSTNAAPVGQVGGGAGAGNVPRGTENNRKNGGGTGAVP